MFDSKIRNWVAHPDIASFAMLGWEIPEDASVGIKAKEQREGPDFSRAIERTRTDGFSR
jgi:hypothetical protein